MGQHLATRSTGHGGPCSSCTAFAARVVPNPGGVLSWLGGLGGRSRGYLGADLRAGLVVVCLVVDIGRSTGRAGTCSVPAASCTVVGADVVGYAAWGGSCCGGWVWRGRACWCLDARLSKGAFCFFSYPFVVAAGESYTTKAKRCQ